MDRAAELPDSSISETPDASDTYYVPKEVEEDEDEDFVVHGETVPEDVDSDDDDIPIRRLKDFAIYERSPERPLVYFERSLCSGADRTFGASGYVEPYVESDDDSSEEASTDGDRPLQYARLSEIKDIIVHTVRDKPSFALDP